MAQRGGVGGGGRAVAEHRKRLVAYAALDLWVTLRAMAVVAVGERDLAEELYAALLPVRGQLAGVASTSLAMRPVAHTLAELAWLLGRSGATAEHREEAVAVARSWAAPHWEAAALTGEAANR